MIEIVKEPTPVEHGDVAEPRNIRQIGQLQGNTIVYIEDYVYRFLHSEGREKKKYAFVFLGQIKKQKEKEQIYIKGAIELPDISFGDGMPVFSEDIWDQIYRGVRQYFPEWSILGWAMQSMGQSNGHLAKIQKICSRHFPGNHGNVLIYDAYGEWENLYLDRFGVMEQATGFCIYYEKNAAMSAYLSDYHAKKEQEFKESSDLDGGRFLVHDESRFDGAIKQDREAMARYRMYMNEQQDRSRHQISKVAVSIAVVVMVLLSGVLFQNYAELNEMQDAVDALASQQSTQEEQDRIIEETISQSATELAEAGTGQQAQTTDGQTQGTEAQTSDAAAASAEAQTNVYLAQGYYVVEQGDKLTDISKKVYGTEDMVQQICERNNITDMDHICAGDKLMLP